MGYFLLLIAMAYTHGNKKNEDDFIEIAFGYITLHASGDHRKTINNLNLGRVINGSITKSWYNSQRPRLHGEIQYWVQGSASQPRQLNWAFIWKILLLCSSQQHLRMFWIGTLRSNDADGNENVKKKGLISKTTTSHVHHTFLYIPFPFFHDHDVKMPNFAFYAGRKRQATTKFYFSFWAWIWSFEIQLQEGSPTFERISG